MAKWRKISEDSEPSLTSGALGGPLADVSGVKPKKLKRDFKRARTATVVIEDQFWRHLYITPEEAASILGTDVAALSAMPLHHFPEFEEEGGGQRYFREQVEWLRDTGNNMPMSWRPHFPDADSNASDE